MTINEAFSELSESDQYKEISKQKNSLGSKYRIYLSRFKAGQLKAGAIVEMLLVHGYEIKANNVTKNKKTV